jgi:hypothetical protein
LGIFFHEGDNWVFSSIIGCANKLFGLFKLYL